MSVFSNGYCLSLSASDLWFDVSQILFVDSLRPEADAGHDGKGKDHSTDGGEERELGRGKDSAQTPNQELAYEEDDADP